MSLGGEVVFPRSRGVLNCLEPLGLWFGRRDRHRVSAAAVGSVDGHAVAERVPTHTVAWVSRCFSLNRLCKKENKQTETNVIWRESKRKRREERQRERERERERFGAIDPLLKCDSS